jgi:putative DNA primase/helicase
MSDDVINLEEERRRKADAQHVVAEAVKDTGVLTHDGIAEIFAARYEGKLRYCHDTKAWFEFVGTHWKQDERSRAFEYVRETNREISTGREIKELKTLRSVGFARGVETFARGDTRLAVNIDNWDRNPFLLGTPGGTVDLRTGELRPSDPADGITKIAGVAPSIHTDCPIWDGFMRDITGGDVELVRFLRQFLGYCLTGDVSEHALLFIHGSGGNGKSVFLNTVARALGQYATASPIDTFTISNSDRHPTELARLRGMRMVSASETEHKKSWAETKIKQLTGGDEVAAHFMHQDFFTFRPVFKLMIIGNQLPGLEHVDDALRRRFNIVPFTFRPKNPDRQLEAKLAGELPEILRWAIRGCLDWQKHGLVRPASVLSATTEYFNDQDAMGRWIDEYCELGNYMAETKALHASFQSFLKAEGEAAQSARLFVQALLRRPGVEKYRKNSFRGFKGIRLQVWGEA